ncbi:MAG: hypothetical protein IPN99_09850 [Bacteroidetes bacterium]|nr:hypothetical protein [Bacteroidota bacterium]
MRPKKRIIKFYTLIQKDWETSNSPIPAQRVKYIIDMVILLERKKRVFDITKQKFCVLESSTFNESNKTHSLIFKSAKTDYRPDLFDRETIQERKNPKKSTEGDGEKTHLIIKYKDDDVFIVLEKNGKGINIRAIVKYFQKFAKKYMASINEKLNFSFEEIPMIKENFLEEIKKLKRVVLGQVYVDKSILGSPALNYSNRIQEIKHNIILSISAEREQNIIKTIEDLWYKLTAPDSKIEKIRVTGKNSINGDVIIDTGFIEKVDQIEAEINEATGVVTSTSIMTKLTEIAQIL